MIDFNNILICAEPACKDQTRKMVWIQGLAGQWNKYEDPKLYDKTILWKEVAS